MNYVESQKGLAHFLGLHALRKHFLSLRREQSTVAGLGKRDGKWQKSPRGEQLEKYPEKVRAFQKQKPAWAEVWNKERTQIHKAITKAIWLGQFVRMS